MAWVAEHKADVLAYLKKVTGDVEAGKIPPAYDCDITETACMEQMGITQPDAQAYMKEHGAEVEANMKKFEVARDAFVKAHSSISGRAYRRTVATTPMPMLAPTPALAPTSTPTLLPRMLPLHYLPDVSVAGSERQPALTLYFML